MAQIGELDEKSWRGLAILAKDGPAYQEARRPLAPVRPLIEAKYAVVTERRQVKGVLIEEVSITDLGRAALSRTRGEKDA